MKQGISLLALALALGSSLAACGEDESKSCDLSGNDRSFWQCCSENSQCASGLCFKFGDGTQACTLACSSDSDCPEGSQGKKCNNQKVCRT